MRVSLVATLVTALGGCIREPVAPTSAALIAPFRQSVPTSSIVKIVLDDCGWDLITPSVMPELEALVQGGLRFRQFYTQPTCSTTRYQADFGRWAWTQDTLVQKLVPPSTVILAPAPGGIGDLPFNAGSPTAERLPLSAVSIFEALAPSHHVSLIGKWHLGRAPLFGEMDQIPSGPYCQGVEEWKAGSDTVLQTLADYDNWQETNDGDRAVSSVYVTDAQADQAVAQLLALEAAGQPFFLEIGFGAVHQPWNDVPPGATCPFSTDREKLECIAAYLSRRLQDVFAAVGPNTYVFLFSDNGTDDPGRPLPAPSGRWKGSGYQGGINCPLIVWGPGITPGDTDRLVSSVDLAATMVEVAGVAPVASFEHSVSCADELRPGIFLGAAPRDFLCVQRYEVVGGPGPKGFDCTVIVERQTAPGLQLKWIIQDEDGEGPGTFSDKVFNLKSDPFELLGGPASSLPTGLRSRLESELASIPPRL